MISCGIGNCKVAVRRRGGGPFDPGDLSGSQLVYWIDASTITGVAHNTGLPQANLIDQSPNGVASTTHQNLTYYNPGSWPSGQPTIYATAAGNSLIVLPDIMSGKTAGMLVYAGRRDTINGINDGGLFKFGTADANADHWPFYGDQLYTDFGRTNRSTFNTATAPWQTAHIGAIESTSSIHRLSRNGTVLVTNGAGTVAWRTAPRIFQGLGTSWEGALCELMVFGVQDVTLRQQAEGYLAHKWGLTAELPSDHPWKSSPPVNP
jgi:hypothetical protein